MRIRKILVLVTLPCVGWKCRTLPRCTPESRRRTLSKPQGRRSVQFHSYSSAHRKMSTLSERPESRLYLGLRPAQLRPQSESSSDPQGPEGSWGPNTQQGLTSGHVSLIHIPTATLLLELREQTWIEPTHRPSRPHYVSSTPDEVPPVGDDDAVLSHQLVHAMEDLQGIQVMFRLLFSFGPEKIKKRLFIRLWTHFLVTRL